MCCDAIKQFQQDCFVLVAVFFMAINTADYYIRFLTGKLEDLTSDQLQRLSAQRKQVDETKQKHEYKFFP